LLIFYFHCFFLKIAADEVNALSSLLRVKTKVPVAALVVCLLMKGLQEQRQWPESVAWAFVEDAAGERTWVDLDEARPLVENITASFCTKQPNKLLLPSEISLGRSESPGSDDEAASGRKEVAGEKMDTGPISKRFREEVIEAIVMETVREHLSRRQQPDAVGRNLLKLMAATSGLPEVGEHEIA